VACLLLTYLVNLLVGHDAETQLLVMVVAAAAVFEPFYLLNQFFTANIQSRYHAYSEITKTLVSTAVKILLIWYRAPLIWFALVLILESLTYALVSCASILSASAPFCGGGPVSPTCAACSAIRGRWPFPAW
jgi:O-antigen/teichoic acid export membrane protein